MTTILDVAIGLVFTYVVLSLIASAAAEALEHFLRYRADYLRQGIEKLLLYGKVELRESLYAHPLIRSLATPSWWEKVGRSPGPAYVPARQFTLALLDLVSRPAAPAQGENGAPAVVPPPPATVAELLRAIEAKGDELPPALHQALRTLIADAGDDMDKVKANVREWFDGSMDRVAGWYKGRAQLVLLVIGAAIAIGINVDTLSIVTTLSNDQAVRAAVVAAAETYAREHPVTTTPVAGGQPQRADGEAAGDAKNPGTPAGGSDGAANDAPASQDAAKGPPQSPATQTASSTQTTPSANKDLEEIRTNVNAVTRQLSGLGLPVGWRYYDAEVDGTANAHCTSKNPAACAYLAEHRIWPGRTHPWVQPGDSSWPGWFEGWWAFAMAQVGTHFIGWLLTAIALSFGAPFWFDTLNKIMVIRSTVKPHEKSGEEGSEDRQAPAPGQTVRVEIAGAKA